MARSPIRPVLLASLPGLVSAICTTPFSPQVPSRVEHNVILACNSIVFFCMSRFRFTRSALLLCHLIRSHYRHVGLQPLSCAKRHLMHYSRCPSVVRFTPSVAAHSVHPTRLSASTEIPPGAFLGGPAYALPAALPSGPYLLFESSCHVGCNENAEMMDMQVSVCLTYETLLYVVVSCWKSSFLL